MREQKIPPEYSNQAKKYLNALNKKTKQRIKRGIEKIPLGDISPYKKNLGSFRLRVGGFRIVFKWLSDEQILVMLINTRGQVYKKGV